MLQYPHISVISVVSKTFPSEGTEKHCCSQLFIGKLSHFPHISPSCLSIQSVHMSWSMIKETTLEGVFWFMFWFLIFFLKIDFLCSFGACPGTKSCRPGWAQTHRGPPASTSQVLGLKACTTIARLEVFFPSYYFSHICNTQYVPNTMPLSDG